MKMLAWSNIGGGVLKRLATDLSEHGRTGKGMTLSQWVAETMLRELKKVSGRRKRVAGS